MPQRIPLIPSNPFYQFATELSGVRYLIDVRWNVRDSAWYMTVLDENETPVLSGMRIVLGALLGIRSASLSKPDGAFVVSDLSNEGREATFNDLGTRVVVSFFTSEELSS